MSSNFHPDYGLFVKTTFNTDTFIFYGLQTDHIMRIGVETYSIFTTYPFDNTIYALSLDFDIELLPAFFKALSGYFSDVDLADMRQKLTDSELRYKTLQWKKPVGDFSCSTTLGEMQSNQNESYIPFVVKAFI